jgi:opacity protein-like surface antigen
MKQRIMWMLGLVIAMTMATAAGQARADDAPRFGFDGVYAGFSVTGGYAESHWSAGGAGASDRLHLSGRGGGALAGINWREGDTVFGVALDISATQIDGSGHGGPCAAGCATTLERYAALRLQLGQRVGAAGHVYGFAGLAWGRFDLNPAGQPRQQRDAQGWLAGIGYEQALEGGWSWRAELQVMGFDDLTYSAAGPALRVGLDRSGLIRIGLVRYF